MTGWNRLKQVTRETISSKDKTEIPTDVTSLLLKAESVEHLHADMMSKTLPLFPEYKIKTKNADDPVKSQPLFLFGQAMDQMAIEYHQDPAVREFFLRSNTALCELAAEKAKLDEVAHQAFIEPKRQVRADRIEEARAHYEKLKQRRLDLDAEKHKLKTERKSGDESGKVRKYELVVQSAQQRFDNEVVDIRNLLTPLNDDLQMGQEARQQTACVLRAMRDYYRHCYEMMCQLDTEVEFEAHSGSSTSNRSTSILNRCPSKSEFQPTSALSQGSKSLTALPVSHGSSTTSLSAQSTPSRTQLSSPPVHARQPRSNIPAGAIPVMLPPPTQSLKPKPNLTAQHRPPPPAPPTTMKSQCKALYDFQAVEPGDLSMLPGDCIEIKSKNGGDWWEGYNTRTKQHGSFPSNYVTLI